MFDAQLHSQNQKSPLTSSLASFSAEFRQPAEWEKHKACWLAWPSHAELWQENLPGAQEEFIALCEAIADLDPATRVARGERLEILVPHEHARIEAQAALSHLPVHFHEIPFGDIWLRDTAPVFMKNAHGTRATTRFEFNGWGGKYDLPHDPEVAQRIANAAGLREISFPWILEGGSIEVDGEGTCLTSRQCLLNENRNPAMTEAEVEAAVCEAFGVEKVLWITEGLLNDHTDGHIDTIARFARPGVVLCMQATEPGDPNETIYERIATELSEMTDAKERKFDVRRIPSPGRVTDEDGRLMPASYLNFYISNTQVIVPTYGSVHDTAAVDAIAACFPERKTVGLSAFAILSGGGAFHCITQQEPA